MMLVYLCTWAVPVFIMVTGALQLNPNIQLSIKELFTVYIWRVLKALILFCLVFQLFDIGMNGEPFNSENILKAFSEMFLGKSWAHIWYLYMLIGLYLLTPFFRMIAAHGTKKELKYGLAVTIFFISCVPLLRIAEIETAFIIPLTTIYPVYLFLGYAIEHKVIDMKKWQGVLLTIIGCALLIGLTVYKYNSFQEMPDILLGSYAGFATVILSCGAFGLMKNIRIGAKVDRFLLAIDKCSFGIYLIHMIFIRLILRYWQFNPYEYGAWMFAAVILLIFIVSYAIVWVLKKLPILRKIL